MFLQITLQHINGNSQNLIYYVVIKNLGKQHCIKNSRYNKKTTQSEWFFCLETGIDLSSRAVSSQVLLAQVSLTSVFGMGTGGTSPLQTPVMVEY